LGWVFDSETVGGRSQILTVSGTQIKLRKSGTGEKKAAKYGPPESEFLAALQPNYPESHKL